MPEYTEELEVDRVPSHRVQQIVTESGYSLCSYPSVLLGLDLVNRARTVRLSAQNSLIQMARIFFL